jgi:hypothetical protein
MHRRSLLPLLALPLLIAPPATATQFPSRPITLVVPFAPGGPSDTTGRLLAEAMSQRLGQPVTVENIGGAGSTIGAARVARAAPDGHTWLHTDNGILAYNPALYARLPFDPDRDLTGVGFIGRFPLFADHDAAYFLEFDVPEFGSCHEKLQATKCLDRQGLHVVAQEHLQRQSIKSIGTQLVHEQEERHQRVRFQARFRSDPRLQATACEYRNSIC